MPRTRPRLSLIVALTTLLAAAALLALAWTQLAPWPQTGATYLAKQTCSCLFLTGRSEKSCRSDAAAFERRFRLAIDRSGLPKTATVTAKMTVFRGEAVYEEGYGCRIVR